MRYPTYGDGEKGAIAPVHVRMQNVTSNCLPLSKGKLECCHVMMNTLRLDETPKLLPFCDCRRPNACLVHPFGTPEPPKRPQATDNLPIVRMHVCSSQAHMPGSARGASSAIHISYGCIATSWDASYLSPDWSCMRAQI